MNGNIVKRVRISEPTNNWLRHYIEDNKGFLKKNFERYKVFKDMKEDNMIKRMVNVKTISRIAIMLAFMIIAITGSVFADDNFDWEDWKNWKDSKGNTPNDIVSVSYEPESPYYYIENDTNDGHYDTDANGKKYFYYSIRYEKPGDKVILKMKDGSKSIYTYSKKRKGYYAANGDSISVWYEFWDDQWENHWYAGQTRYASFWTLGKTCTIPARILTREEAEEIGYTGYTEPEDVDPVHVDPVKKHKQPMTVIRKNKAFKAIMLKKHKKTFKAVTVKNAKGTLSYKITANKNARKALKFNKKTGKITVKRGTKKGKYVFKVKVAASGNRNYYSGAKSVKVVVRVK